MSETPEKSSGEVVLYESPDGKVHLDVLLERESIWLTQKQMAELFGRERSVITRHIQRALADDELSLESNVQKVHIASSDRPVSLYSLDAVISVGYRVNSARGTQFRIWATRTLREHLVRGYTLNERRCTRRSSFAPRTCCTSSSRITRSPTATSASGRCCSWSTSPETSSSRAPTARSASPTTLWSLWRC